VVGCLLCLQVRIQRCTTGHILMGPAEGRNLAALRAWQQRVGPQSTCGSLIQHIMTAYLCVVTYFRRVASAPTVIQMQFLITMTIGVLGLVPGVLTLYGCDKAAVIVSIVAGGVACTLALIQFYPREDWVAPA
jgi:hypothetical protein